MAEEIKEKYPNIKVINIKSDRPLEEVQKEIREKIGYQIHKKTIQKE